MHRAEQVFPEKGLSIAAQGMDRVQRAEQDRPEPVPSRRNGRTSRCRSRRFRRPSRRSAGLRETDSLCPRCAKDARETFSTARRTSASCSNEQGRRDQGAIVERDGKILMVKDQFEARPLPDVMAIDPSSSRISSRVPRPRHPPQRQRTRSTAAARCCTAAARCLTVDLTNRCNMMCDPVLHGRQPGRFCPRAVWDDIKKVLDNAITIKPRRQMSVQFSGGEPTLALLPRRHPLRARGRLLRVQCGDQRHRVRQGARVPAAANAGLRYAYPQFDGVGNAANAHRKSATCST